MEREIFQAPILTTNNPESNASLPLDIANNTPEQLSQEGKISLGELFIQLNNIGILESILSEDYYLFKKTLPYLPELQIPTTNFLTFEQVFFTLSANPDFLLKQGFYPLDIARLKNMFLTFQENLEGIIFTSSVNT